MTRPALFALLLLGCDPDERCRFGLDAAPGCEQGCPTRAELIARGAEADCEQMAAHTCTRDELSYEVIREGELRWFLEEGVVVSVEDRAAEEVCAEVGSRWYGPALSGCRSEGLPEPLPGCEG